jgi:hypothetical protein
MMGRTLFRWKLIKWLTLSNVLSLVRTCQKSKRKTFQVSCQLFENRKRKEIEGVGRTYNAFGIDQEQMLVVTGLHSRQHVLALRALRLANQEISVL